MPIPDPYDECEVCNEMEEDLEGKLLRCSSCKNRFYCSTRCQKKDWNKHKLDCSLLPPGDLPSPAIKPTEDMDAEVQRVARAVKTVVDAWKTIEEESPGMKKAELNKRRLESAEFKEFQEFKLSPDFSWNHGKKQWMIDPLNDLLNATSRLYWMHAIAECSRGPSESTETELKSWMEFFANMRMPSSFTQLFPEKVVKRPGDLSAGEYRMLMQTAGIHFLGKDGKIPPAEGLAGSQIAADERPGTRWIQLFALAKQLGGVQYPGKKIA